MVLNLIEKKSFYLVMDLAMNAIIFGVDMSSSVHIDNKNNYSLILGEGSTQGLDNTIFTAMKKYSINFIENNKKICLSLDYN